MSTIFLGQIFMKWKERRENTALCQAPLGHPAATTQLPVGLIAYGSWLKRFSIWKCSALYIDLQKWGLYSD